MLLVRQRKARGWLAFGFVGALVAGACSGSEFTADGDGSGGASGSSSSGGSSSGSTGSGGSSSGGAITACRGPEECNDGDPCSVDECVQGGCLHPPSCADEEVCCDNGSCGECCADADCDDGIGCTENVCFAGFCAYVPEDAACAANQYCSVESDCLTREPCPNGSNEECDDQNPCTPDTCQDELCHHDFCSTGTQCCPDQGCAECCSDSQCAAEDDDPCTDNVCQGGTCTTVPHCTDGRCCPAQEGSATCGLCCSQQDCEDEFECTVDSCTVDGCKHVVDDSVCPDNQVCSVESGCVSVTGCIGCTPDQVCCEGKCQECCTPEDCLDPPVGSGDPILSGCQSSQCTNGTCSTVYETCINLLYTCCAPYGCFLGECPI